MKIPFREEDPDLAKAITEAYKDLEKFDAEDDEYAAAVDQIAKLHKLKKSRVDPNTVIIAGANVLITLSVLKFEQVNVVTTKVLGFLSKQALPTITKSVK